MRLPPIITRPWPYEGLWTRHNSLVRIIEVGPRDGLQNEPTPIPTQAKAAFIARLAACGLKEIEATSFVSPRWVPQLGDAAELWPLLPQGPLYSALVPNLKGLERALEAGVERIALFTAASDAFTQKNIAMTVEESLAVFEQVIGAFRQAKGPDAWVRGYVSTAFECPYAGPVDPAEAVRVAQRLAALGVDEVSLGDTIGVAVPSEVQELTRRIGDAMDLRRVALPRHARHRARQRAGGAAAGDRRRRQFGGRPGRLPLRAGRQRQPRHRRPPVYVARHGL